MHSVLPVPVEVVMATVLTIVDQPRSLIHLFTVETSAGPIIVLYFDDERFRAMARVLVDLVEAQGLRLGRAEINGKTLDECISTLAREWPDARGGCISDDDPLWPKLLAGISQLEELPLTGLGTRPPVPPARRPGRQ